MKDGLGLTLVHQSSKPVKCILVPQQSDGVLHKIPAQLPLAIEVYLYSGSIIRTITLCREVKRECCGWYTVLHTSNLDSRMASTKVRPPVARYLTVESERGIPSCAAAGIGFPEHFAVTCWPLDQRRARKEGLPAVYHGQNSVRGADHGYAVTRADAAWSSRMPDMLTGRSELSSTLH